MNEKFYQLAECLGDIYGTEEMCMIVGAMSDKDIMAFFE